MSDGWIGVDLDGTLAHHSGWLGEDHIGEPIPLMLERVKRWVAEGRVVKIFTARAFRSFDFSPEGKQLWVWQQGLIQDWLEKHGLPRLEVTCCKDYGMVELWDDRAVQVVPNTGRTVEVGRG